MISQERFDFRFLSFGCFAFHLVASLLGRVNEVPLEVQLEFLRILFFLTLHLSSHSSRLKIMVDYGR